MTESRLKTRDLYEIRSCGAMREHTYITGMGGRERVDRC